MSIPLCAQWGADPPAMGEWRIGTLNGRPIHYVERDGAQLYEGDILLGQAGGKQAGRQAIASLSAGALWTDATVPYVLDSDAPVQDLVSQAMADWTTATNVQFVRRTDQRNYVHIRRAGQAGMCSSNVGMIGGEQFLNLGSDCTAIAVLHELGHAIGLWHEHTRRDRADWITLHPRNINKICIYNYEIPESTREVGAYDFASVMHYAPYAFSFAGLAAMETIPAGIPVSSNPSLSAGDIANIRFLYKQPRRIFVSTFPPAAAFEVDGVTYQSMQVFDWELGSTHVISAIESTQVSQDTRLLFGRWTDNGARTHTVTVDADTSYYTASFIRQYLITTSVKIDGFTGAGSVELTPAAADGYYRDGAIVLATAKAAAGSSFWQWSGIDRANRGTYAEDGSFAVGDTNPRYFTVNLPKNIVASITPVPVITVQTEPPNLYVSVDGRVIKTPRTLRNVLADQWQPGTQHTLGVPDPVQTCRVLCEQSSRWVFQGWRHGGEKEQTLNAPNGATTYTAVFQRQLRITTTATSGTIQLTPESEDGYYPEGALVTATPRPAADRRFNGWFSLLVDVDLPSQFRSTSASCTAPARMRLNEYYDIFANTEFLSSFTPPPVPTVNAEATQDAVGHTTGPVAPGQLIQLSGSNFGTENGLSGSDSFSGFLDTCLGQTTFYFDGIPAPVVSRDTGSAQVVVPYGVSGRSTVSLVVDSRGSRSTPVAIPVVEAVPAIFTADGSGSGAGLIYHDGYVPVTDDNPAAPGEVVLLFASGLGITDPPSPDGMLPDGNTVLRPVLPVALSIGSAAAEELNAVSVPGQVSGLFEITVRIPAEAASGVQPIVLKAGSYTASQQATIAIR